MGFPTNYANCLERIVFPQDTGIGDRKLLRSFRKTLSSTEASVVLSLLHKESDFVTDEERHAAGLQRSFENGRINPTQLARRLCDPDDLLAGISRMQRIVEAGAAYRLIASEQMGPKRSSIGGTVLLDALWRDVAIEDMKLVTAIFGSHSHIGPAFLNRIDLR